MSKKKIILLIVALLVFDQIVKIWIKTHFMLGWAIFLAGHLIGNPATR